MLEASPLSVALEDQDGMSALEHAIFSSAPIKVVKLLQYATRKRCEYAQKKQEAKGQSDLKRRISQDSQDVPQRMSVDPHSEDEDSKASSGDGMSIDPPSEDEGLKKATATIIPAMKGEFSQRRRGAISHLRRV
jgi:hypothetical protein